MKTTVSFFCIITFHLLAIIHVCAQDSNPAEPDNKRIEVLETERHKLTKRLAEIDTELVKLKALGNKATDLVRINNYLGISSDFITIAKSHSDGFMLLDVETGKELPTPKWDRDWGRPRSVSFGTDTIAITTGNNPSDNSVKLFSRKTLELELNVRGQINSAQLTSAGRFLAITEFRPSNGYYLVLRDVKAKKLIAEIRLGGNGYCTLAVGGKHVAAYESHDGQITVVETEIGKIVKKLKSPSFEKARDFGGGKMPLAISLAGTHIACAAEDAVVIYDIEAGKVAQKLDGHLDVVMAVAFSPKGDLLATSGKDKTIRIWNITDGKAIHVVKSLPAVVSELIFSPDSRRIVIIYIGGKVEIRTLDSN